MADSNGEIPLTGDMRVDAALKRIRGKFQDLEDAMIVQAHLEKRQTESIKALSDGQDALQRQQEAIRQQQEAQRKLNEQTDKRIADLVSAIGELISKQNRRQ